MAAERDEVWDGADYSKPDVFGDVRTCSVYVPTGKYLSVDVIEAAGWHKVNRRYNIRRPEVAQAPLILFTVAGCGRVTVNGSSFQVGANEVCFIPADTACEYTAGGEELWEFYWLHFSGRHALDVFHDLLRAAGYRGRFPISTLRPLLERCINTRFSALNGELMASMLLDQILSELLLGFCAGEKDADLVDKLILYLSADSTRALSMEEVERMFHYSKEHIIRVFHKQTNTTPYRYWREIKLAQAKQMLALSDRSVEEVAAWCGYSTAESFAKQFKLRYGVTPHRYRRENRSAKQEEN